jgi:hypothetical protein
MSRARKIAGVAEIADLPPTLLASRLRIEGPGAYQSALAAATREPVPVAATCG